VPRSADRHAAQTFSNERMLQAIAPGYESLGWHAARKDPPLGSGWSACTPIPSIRVEWTKRTAPIGVPLPEVTRSRGSHGRVLADNIARPDKNDATPTSPGDIRHRRRHPDLRLDFIFPCQVPWYYRMTARASGSGSNVHIVPEQRFRDGFKKVGPAMNHPARRDSGLHPARASKKPCRRGVKAPAR